MESSSQVVPYVHPPFGQFRCDWGLSDDITKYLFNFLPPQDKFNLFQVCKHWFELASSNEAGEALLRNACLYTNGKTWMPTYRFFQEKVLYLIFVDCSGSMSDKIADKKIVNPSDADKTNKIVIPPKTRQEVAKAKVLELIKPLSFPMAKNRVYCGQFGGDTSYKLVKNAGEVTEYYRIRYVDSTHTFIDVLYRNINNIYAEIIKDLKTDISLLDITILSDFDCAPSNQNIFDCDTNIRFIRIDEHKDSLVFKEKSLVFYNEPEVLTQDTQDINEIDVNLEMEVIHEEVEEKVLKRKNTTEIAFMDVYEEFPKRPLKKIKISEVDKTVTKWSSLDSV